MKIVSADPHARVLTEDEVVTLLREPVVMHLGMVDEAGWPVVNPVWHLFEDEMFRLVVGRTSHKAKCLSATGRAYFTVDTGGAAGDTRGVRGRAGVRVVDDIARAVDVTRKELLKYTGTDEGAYAEQYLVYATSSRANPAMRLYSSESRCSSARVM
jgi:Pyridoxamine 5'-phosphate oxidase